MGVVQVYTYIYPDDIQASFDVRALYPSIPIKKALEITRERLYSDESLQTRTKWKPDDIITLLEICLETHFKTLDGRIFTQTDVHQSESLYQILSQTST